MSNIFKIIPLQELPLGRNNKSFRQFDVLFKWICKGIQTHGDGEPILIYYDTERLKACQQDEKECADDSFS